jgi:hypothetical protein
MMKRCVVELHLDDQTGTWWAHCDSCRFSAAADDMAEIKRLVRRGHWRAFRWDLMVDNAPPINGASQTETTIVWGQP